MSALRWRRLVVGLALLLALSVAVVWGGAVLVGHALSRSTGLTIVVGRLCPTLVPPGLAASGIRARAGASAAPVVTVARVVVAPDLWVLLRGGLHLRSVVLDRPFLRLARARDGGLEVPGMGGGGGGSSRTLSIDRLEITRARAVVVDGGREKVREKVKVPAFAATGLAVASGRVVRVRGRGEVLAARGVAALRFLYAAWGTRTRLLVAARLAGLEPARLAAELPVRVAGGRLSGSVRYEHAAGGPSPVDRFAASITGDALALRDLPRFAVLDLGSVTLAGIDADLVARALRVAAFSAEDGRIELAGAGAGGPAWAVRVDDLRLARVEIRPNADLALPALTVTDLRGRNLSTADGGGTLVGHAELATGGRVGIDGVLAAAAGGIDGRVDLDAVALPPLLGTLLAPIRTTDGRLSGTLAMSGPPLVATGGTIVLDRFDTVVPREDGGADPAVAVDHLEAEVVRLTLAPPAVHLREVRLLWPYLVVRRDPEGLYPVRFLPHSDGDGAGAASLVVDRIHVEHGGVFFEDRVVDPHYSGSLAETRAEMTGVRAPEVVIEHASLETLVNELAPLSATGHVDGVVEITAKLRRLPLPPLNPYLAPPLGYRAVQGGAGIETTIRVDHGVLDAGTSLVLANLSVERASGADLIDTLVGVPTTLAIALMKDLDGRLHLDLPLSGTPWAPDFSLSDLVLASLKSAVLGALASPLKLVGALFTSDGGKVRELHVDPIAFEAGRDEPSRLGARQVDRLAVLLGQRPALVVALHGRSGPEDADALRDLAIVPRLGTSADERALVRFLSAGAGVSASPAPDLTAEQQRRLEALRRDTPVPEDRLASLARARAARVQTLLGERGLPVARVALAEPALDGPPAVDVDLGSGSR
jgi:hypothetical protein